MLLNKQGIPLLCCILVVNLAVVNLALGAPLSQQQCKPGEYPSSTVNCLPCPDPDKNPPEYLKSFALTHRECPYPPTRGTTTPPTVKGIPGGKGAVTPGSNAHSQATPTDAPTTAAPKSSLAASTDDNASGVPPFTNQDNGLRLVENWHWLLILVPLVAGIMAIVLVGVCCRKCLDKRIRQMCKDLRACLRRVKKTCAEAVPLRGQNQDRDEDQDQGQDQNNNQYDRDQEQGPDQNTAASSDPSMTDNPKHPRFENLG